MSGQLRAELLKQRSTQTTLFLFLAMFGLVALASALHVLAPSPSDLSSRNHQLEVFEVGGNQRNTHDTAEIVQQHAEIVAEVEHVVGHRANLLNPGGILRFPPANTIR